MAAELDPQQREALAAFGAQTVVLAGAGSGKTRVLVAGLAELLGQGVAADEIVLLSFTRRAAEEMRSRAAELAAQDLSELRCGTFHSLGANLLREAGREFQILGEDEAQELLADLALELAIERFEEELEGPSPALLLELISRAREDQQPLAGSLPEALSDRRHFIEALAERYAGYKRSSGLYDYTDILLELVALLAERRPRLAAVLVDEAQDLNRVQWQIVDLLCQDGAWKILVGDPEQTIYSWRGAVAGALPALAEEPATTLAKLERNYRSRPELIELANALTRGPLRLELVAQRESSGVRPRLERYDSAEQEALALADWIERQLDAGSEPEQIALIARQHTHLLGRRRGELDEQRRLLTALLRLTSGPDRSALQVLTRALPFEDSERQELLTELTASPAPLELLAERTGEQALRALGSELAGRSASSSLWRSLCYGVYGQLLGQAGRGELALELAELAPAEAEGEELFDALALAAAEQQLGPGVRLGTVHATKGLEWDHVAVLRLAPGSFPARGARRSSSQMAEERRLLYVAVTRARESLLLSEAGWLLLGAPPREHLLDEPVLALLEKFR